MRCAAFTPTCTDEHLPGYIRNARKFRRLGVKKLAVITTNDRFIMTAWKKAMKDCMQAEGLSTIDTEVTMVSDKDAELIKALGLAFNMAPKKKAAWSFQLNAGLRSKRFALVAEEGVVTHLAVDEGDTEMVGTSAEEIMNVLRPAGSSPALSSEVGTSQTAVIGVVLAALVAGALYAADAGIL